MISLLTMFVQSKIYTSRPYRSFDWREVVDCDWNVPTQGFCAAANWALVIAKVHQYRQCVHNKQSYLVSAQEMIDCGVLQNKRDVCQSFQNIQQIPFRFLSETGVGLQSQYPFNLTNYQKQACKGGVRSKNKINLNRLNATDAQTVKQSLLVNGPMAIIVKYYDSLNYFHDSYRAEGSAQGVRAFILTGWTGEFWICQGSEGKGWGNLGDLKIGMSDGSILGFMQMAE